MAYGGYGAPVGPVPGPVGSPVHPPAFGQPMDPFSVLLARLGIGGGGHSPFMPHAMMPGGPVFNGGQPSGAAQSRPVDVPMFGHTGGGPVFNGGPGGQRPVDIPVPFHVGPQPVDVPMHPHLGDPRAVHPLGDPRFAHQLGAGGDTSSTHPIVQLLSLLRGAHTNPMSLIRHFGDESASSMHVHQRNKDLLAHQARRQGL